MVASLCSQVSLFFFFPKHEGSLFLLVLVERQLFWLPRNGVSQPPPGRRFSFSVRLRAGSLFFFFFLRGDHQNSAHRKTAVPLRAFSSDLFSFFPPLHPEPPPLFLFWRGIPPFADALRDPIVPPTATLRRIPLLFLSFGRRSFFFPST